MANQNLGDKTIMAELRAHFGLDRPVYIQYAIWLRDFVQGEWGKSIGSGEPVMDMFLDRLRLPFGFFLAPDFLGFSHWISRGDHRGAETKQRSGRLSDDKFDHRSFHSRLLGKPLFLFISLPSFYNSFRPPDMCPFSRVPGKIYFQ